MCIDSSRLRGDLPGRLGAHRALPLGTHRTQSFALPDSRSCSARNAGQLMGARCRAGQGVATAQLFTTKLLQMDLDNDHKLRYSACRKCNTVPMV